MSPELEIPSRGSFIYRHISLYLYINYLLNYLPFSLSLRRNKEMHMEKIIISVLGKDAVGIIAKVCTYLASCNVNVNDISQTIVQGYFNMMMIVDVSGSSKKLGDIQADLDELGTELGVQIKCQREEIFDKMHRI